MLLILTEGEVLRKRRSRFDGQLQDLVLVGGWDLLWREADEDGALLVLESALAVQDIRAVASRFTSLDYDRFLALVGC